MIITALRLKNFRTYRGVHEIRFATNPKRGVTIITGPNGSGKTGLFLALNWCMYGVGAGTAGRLLSKRTGSEVPEDGFVEVQFHHDGVRYVARRDLFARGMTGEETGDLALLALGSGGRSKEVPNPSQKMNEILPADAREYFFFDAERIDDMSKPQHADQVREAIRSVLKLTVLERAIQHLSGIERDFAKKVRQSGQLDDEAAELVAELETFRDSITGLKERQSSKRAGLEARERQKDDIEDRLKSLDEFRGQMLQEAELDADLASAESRADATIERMAEWLTRAGPALAGGAVAIAAQILDEKRKRGEIPSNIRRQLIDDLLRADVCICDRPLDAASRNALVKRRDSAHTAEMENVVLVAAGSMDGLDTMVDHVPGELALELANLADLADRMDELQRQKDELRSKIDDQLRGRPASGAITDVKGLEGSRRQLEGAIRDLTFELGRIDGELAKAENEHAAKTDVLNKMESKSTSAKREKRRYELASLARSAAQELLDRFRDDMQTRIETEIDSIFKELIWKKEHIASVRILDDYRLDVIDRWGASALRELSAGERQVLSLSFIAAMSRVTGEEAPLVIDTPFGRISERPTHNIADSLPEIASQLVLLVTDKELDATAHTKIAPHVGAEYSLSFDDRTGVTDIVEETLHG